MKSNLIRPRIKKQTGAALLIAMVVLASMAAFYVLNKMGPASSKLNRQDARVASLAEAKNALIAYAVNYADSNNSEYGFLPCPDTDEAGTNPEEGHQDVGCGVINESMIGRFPYRAVQLAPQKDEANECIWYAVSGSYKNQPQSAMLNDDTNGLFTVFDAQGNLQYGVTPESRVVAIVFAPNTLLPSQSQNRAGGVVNTEQCGGNYTVSNYLEGDGTIDNSVVNGVDAVDSFIRSATGTESLNPAYNDRIAVITQGDIWSAVKRRRDFENTIQNLTASIANCIADYGNAGAGAGAKNLPWPAALDLAGADYRDDVSYADVTAPASLLGRLPENVSNSETQLDNNAGAGGGGTGGVSVAGPPSCNQCKEKYDKYIEELGEELADFRLDVDEANADYQLCLNDASKTQAECDATLAQDLADAQAKYDEELAEIADDEFKEYNDCLLQHSCSSTGGGSASDCSSCQADFDTAVADAVKDRDKDLGSIPGQYTSCIKQADNAAEIAACDEERDEDIADANEDYAEDIAEAEAIYDLCTSVNSCPTAGGSKDIENILNGCLVTEEFKLWQHWKDHYFYVVSGSYAPDSTNVTCTVAGANCVKTNGSRHAGIVFFAGERLQGITRNGPVAGDTDTKNTLANYLEGANVGDVFPNPPDPAGNRTYDAGAGNDYLYCINDTDPMTTGVCP